MRWMLVSAKTQKSSPTGLLAKLKRIAWCFRIAEVGPEGRICRQGIVENEDAQFDAEEGWSE